MNDTEKNINGEISAVRIFFSKTDRAKYISHLDLNRTMQRALKRSKLPAWETEGFNQHIYITFALPLSLGIESVCEAMDIKLTQPVEYDEIKEKLNNSLPFDLRVIYAAKPIYKHTEIKKAEYRITADIRHDDFSQFLSQEKIPVMKRTKKKGISEIDLKPYIEYSPKDKEFILVLPSGTDFNINPLLVLDAFEGFIGRRPDVFNITRTNIYTENGERFV